MQRLAFLSVLLVATPVPAKETWVPATFSTKQDRFGNSWDLYSSYGYLYRGTNSSFYGAGKLYINNSTPSMQTRLMKPGGLEYRYLGYSGNINIRRDITLDMKNGFIRYVDTFSLRNVTTPQPLQLKYYLRVNRANATKVFDDGGKSITSVQGQTLSSLNFNKNQKGIVIYSNPTYQQAQAAWLVQGKNAKVQPRLQISSSKYFYVYFNLTVTKSKPISIISGVVQRPYSAFRTTPNAKQAAAFFDPLESSAFRRGIDPKVRRNIVNGRFGGFGGWRVEFDELDSLGVTPSTADVLAIGERTRIQGTARWKKFTITNRFGSVDLTPDQVAGVAGPRSGAKKPRVFLRDGQALTGEIAIEGLSFAMYSGLTLQPDAGKLDRLVMRKADDEKKPSVYAMVVTQSGDRLALAKPKQQLLKARTPWGARDVPLAKIMALRPVQDGVGYRLWLEDGTTMFAFLPSAKLELPTSLFGTVSFDAYRLSGFARVKAPDELPNEEPAGPHLVLLGENRLMGTIGADSITFRTAAGDVSVPPRQINTLQSDGSTAGQRHFVATLWDGSVIRGRMREQVLPVKAWGTMLRVPTADLVSVRLPAPVVSEKTRGKIARLIEQLGHDDYHQREAATQRLADLGLLAREQLRAAAKSSDDPEIKRRVEALREALAK